jgi:sugar/nucleoside kinase (ribokinase family)
MVMKGHTPDYLMYDICCVGHITSDKVITPESAVNMPGGTALYFSSALQHFPAIYRLITAVAENEMHFVSELRNKGTDVVSYPTAHTVCFENIYTSNQDHRVQKVSQKADSFTIDQLKGTEASIFHLGPLLADDIPVALIKHLASITKVSLDAQGYLRQVRGNNDVYAIDWQEKRDALQYVHVLKANETEAAVLTGSTDIYQSARILADWGVAEVLLTLGSMGSVIYADSKFYMIPAFTPTAVIDATGCGDTYMAGYLYRRCKGDSAEQAGRFAAAMATIKIQSSGPFDGTEADVELVLSME